MIDITAIRERYAALSQHLDERARRIFAATEAKRFTSSACASRDRTAECVSALAGGTIATDTLGVLRL